MNQTTFYSRSKNTLLALTASLALLAGTTVQAMPSTSLGLNTTNPDIMSGMIETHYDAETDDFSANGMAAIFTSIDLTQSMISDGLFSLTAKIDESGMLASGGKLVITGGLFGSSTTDELLTGDLTVFGYGLEIDPLEFLFDITGGTAAELFGGEGGVGGIILGDTGFGETFLNNFGATWAVSNTFAVPAPAAIWLFGLGLLGMTGIVGRRHKLVKNSISA